MASQGRDPWSEAWARPEALRNVVELPRRVEVRGFTDARVHPWRSPRTNTPPRREKDPFSATPSDTYCCHPLASGASLQGDS
jgi:hypothetical protein